jgi:hypothetical protein
MRRQRQAAEERELHAKTQNETHAKTLMKCFSEKLAPGIYDSAAKKEAFGLWKEEFRRRV